MKRAVTRNAAGKISRSPKRVPRNTRKPNYRLMAWVFVASAMVACAAGFAVQTPLLRVRSIDITGVKLADGDAVRASVKYALGQNILLVRKSPAIQSMDKISEVASVRMGRTFPDRMWVEVRERKPFAVLSVGFSYFLMQSNGLVFHESRDPMPGLPIIEASDIGQARVGGIPSCPDVSFALEALKAAGHEGISVDKISIDHAGNMCLNMDSNFCIRLGQPDEIARKMSLVHRALDSRPSYVEGEYFDVSAYPYQMVWKPKS